MITLILTAVLVVITGVYAYLTFQILQTNRAAVAAMREQIAASLRPYVSFDLVPFGSVLIEAHLHNTGRTAAHNVRVTTKPQLRRVLRGESSPAKLTENVTALLPPSAEVVEFIAGWPDFKKWHAEQQFSGAVSYSDSTGHLYDEPFRIDLSVREGMSHVGRADMAEELKNISEHLKDIKRYLGR